MKLTQAVIERGKIPTGGKADYIAWDDDLPGFGVRIREGGSRVFVVQYKIGAKNRRMTLGSVQELTLSKARDCAKGVLAKVHLGEDPQAEKSLARSTATETFKAVAERFLERQEKRLRGSSYSQTKLYLLTHCKKLHGLKLDNIGRADIASLLSSIAQDRPVSADRARAALSALFAWALREGLCESNPVIGTNKYAENRPRERVLSDKELAAIWKAASDGDYGTIVKLLMLTGSRREEIAGLKWSEVDLEARKISLPAERTKNHRPHDVPLSELAHGLLASRERNGRGFVFGKREGAFQGFTKAKRDLDEKLDGMPEWHLHDLRRTAATRMAELGVQPHIVEAVLNHISGHKAGVAGIYNKAAYAPEKVAALDVWANHIAVILAQAEGANVHRLRSAQ